MTHAIIQQQLTNWYLLLHQLYNGAGVHEELIVVSSLGDGGSVTVNDIHDLYAGELIQHGCDVRGIVGQRFLDGLLNWQGDAARDC